ncbi:flavin reductase family protein [Mycobacterium sp. LTG2003]
MSDDHRTASAAFDDLVGLLDYPMFVVTARAGDRMGGCLVGFATQSSINPPKFLIGLSRKNHTFKVAQDATHLGVHLVARNDIELARWFGSETGDTVDKFKRWSWREGPEGTPILEAAAAWFVGSITRRFDLGDHVGHLLEPVAGQAPDGPHTWVSFTDVKDLEPGHEA